MFHRDSSKRAVSRSESGGRRRAALAAGFFAAALAVTGESFSVRTASAQTPTTPSEPAQQPGQTQPAQPSQPIAEPQQLPIQQFQQPLQPGRTPLTPASPPTTTIPLWTPPVPPPPSQTNVPGPFPFSGAPGSPGTLGGIPNLTIPGAFSPTVTTVRGAAIEFHPTARASLEYSDNFFQTTSRSEDNLRSILGPGFVVFVNGARTFGRLSTTIDLVHDTVRSANDEVRVLPSLEAAIRYALTPRLALTLTDTYIRNDSAAVADQSGIRRGRRLFNQNTLGLSVDWLLDQVATQAYYKNVLFVNENGSGNGGSNSVNNNTSGVNDEDTLTHILGVNATARIAANYLVRGGYEFSKSDVIGGGPSGDDTTSHTFFTSLARQLGLYSTAGISGSFQQQSNDNARIYNASLFGAYGLPTGLSLSGSVGYSILDSDADNEHTVSANVSASYRFTRAMISVGAFQDFRQTAQEGQNFGTVVTRTYFGSFLYQFTPFLNSIVQVSYSENEPTGVGNSNGGGTQTHLTYGASLNWQALRWLTARLQYSYTKQRGDDVFNQGTSGGTDSSYAENLVTLSLFATF